MTKTPNRYIVPPSPTVEQIHDLWVTATTIEARYKDLQLLVRMFAGLGTAPKLMRRLRLARSSAAGAVRAAWGRHTRAQMNYQAATVEQIRTGTTRV